VSTLPATERWRRRLGAAGVSAVGVLLAVAVHLHVWRARLSEPFVRGGDADYYLMLARSLMRHGSWLHNSSLGWPFGQQLFDSPEGADNLHLLLIRLFGWLGGSPGAAVNLFYLWTFAAVAFTSHLVLRRLGRSQVASFIGAFVYAFAPFHFIRGESHLFLSGYEMLPIGILLALMLFDEPLPLLRESGLRGVRWRSRGTWMVLLAIAALASTGPYYFAFSMLLIVVAASLTSVSHGSWRPAVAGAWMVVVGVGVFVLNLSPSLLNQLRHGANAAVISRSPFETELYGLKIFQLFVPRQLHRIDVVARLSQRSQGPANLLTEPGQQLGLLGAIVLGVMLLAFAGRAFGMERRRRWLGERDAQLIQRTSAFAVMCMLIGAIGGFSFFLSLVVRDIRAYNRISIVIAFFTVIGLATAVDLLVARYASRRWLGVAAAILLVAVAFLDQGGQDTPPYASIHATSSSDASFFGSVRNRLGSGASVFDLPFQPFLEVPPRVGTGPYDEARGFIFEPSLNWSFGFMRGRQPDYPAVLETQPTGDWMRAISAIGFTGIVLDRAGYSDADRQRLETEIAALAGEATASPDGRYAFFDLRAYSASVRAQLGPNGIAALAARTLALHTGP
jgi:phosphoglycerol transferase